jgi:hypothetical protein
VNVAESANLPQVSLSRWQNVRLIVVGFFAAIVVGHSAGDLVRTVYPLHFFGYTTNADGIVVSAPATPPRGSDRIEVGDRVRIDRIQPFDRKGGLAGGGAYSYDNPDRYLPIERNGHERILHLVAEPEPLASRFIVVIRILLLIAAIMMGGLLFLVKPSIATAAFFAFCLTGVTAPATYLDYIIPNPWRPILPWVGDEIAGAVRPALLLFAFCLIDGDEDPERERFMAIVCAILGLVLGTMQAYSNWRLTYAGEPAQMLTLITKQASLAVGGLCVIAFLIAFVRARGDRRHRIGWVAISFLLAGACHLLSDALYPGRIAAWFNALLISTAMIPIVVTWISVVRHRFFNVDFVVSRAVVYTALTAALLGSITATEEIGTYIFYNNTTLSYGVCIIIAMAVGSCTGRLTTIFDAVADRFIFRDRRAQRLALEFIAGYILDAETEEDVHRALLQDAAHALQLSFGGILERQRDGGYILGEHYGWPEGLTFKLGPNDELTRAITRTRGALTFSGKDTRLIQDSFPNEQLTFAAPLFFDRHVSGIVVYGHNVSGLDLDPDEREHLVRVVAHASIALNAIALARYRSLVLSASPATT